MATLYTVGHSNRSLEEFLNLLHSHNITHIVDVRTIPKSRRLPWFNREALKRVLQQEKIKYTHMPELGGLRHSHKDSINQGWKNTSFRGYADYMQTDEFYLGLKELNQLVKANKHLAIMCAEAVPWRCHRSLIADAEVIRGVNVLHIMSKTSIKPHELTEFAVVDKKKRPMRIYYPKDNDLFSNLEEN